MSVDAAATAWFAGVALGADGGVVASFDADAGASVAGTELAPPTGAAGLVALDASGAPRWARAFPGKAGAVAIAGDLAVVAVAGTGELDLGAGPVALRGAPGAAVVGVAAADGADRWVRPIGATDWVVARALAALPGGDVAVVGSFAGTLRVADVVLTAAGPSDGFVARLGPGGEVRWAIRLGGERVDAVAAVAATPDGLVIGGTYTGDADLRGVALAPVEADVLAADGFVARLGGDGAVRWARGFGGASDDAVAGVAVTPAGLVAVAATLRGAVLVDDKPVTTRGLADAALLTFDGDGRRRAIALVGGADYDSAAGLAVDGDDLALAVSYSGAVLVGDTRLDAAGGDGAAVVVLDAGGAVARVHDVAGPGRETVAAIAGGAGGWAAAVRHTAGATVDGAVLGAPTDPYGGAALLVRGE